ncbi:MAG: aminomethyltransferase family protein, partial [Proteobacteria bacterium]|nr:aminomethyltransferase family protein [Pseudomonadota bacterium]
AGACFGEKLGWERPNWFAPEGFAPKGVAPRDEPSFSRPNWFDAVAAEHAACRERVSVFDESSFAKFEMIGADAERALSWICAGDVAKPPGRLTYSQMLNARGGIECDLTVARLAPDRFYIVTGTGFATHDFQWIASHVPTGLDARLVDVTSAFAVIALMGPRARDVLGALTRDDIADKAFPFGCVRDLSVAGAPVRALRLTYVGELGWELHVPVEFAPGLYDAILEAGRAHGIANGGYRAIESLRLEKGYRVWGAELTPDHSPLEAGLGWAVKLSSEVPFLGREALLASRAHGLERRLAGFSVDDPDVVLLGRETIYRDGERVGWLTSGGFGHTVGRPIGYGYVKPMAPERVDRAFLTNGRYELEVATRRVPAALHLRPLYDPDMARVKS